MEERKEKRKEERRGEREDGREGEKEEEWTLQKTSGAKLNPDKLNSYKMKQRCLVLMGHIQEFSLNNARLMILYNIK